MPEEFNVHLFERATESGVVYGSKAVGEPPLMHGVQRPRGAAAGGRRVRPGRAVGSTSAARRPRRPCTGRSRRPRPRRAAGATAESPGAGGGLTWTGCSAVQQLRHDGLPGVLVTVIEVRGHAPRDAGAKMVVGADQVWGSVGGGNLEEAAVTPGPRADRRRRRARDARSHGSTSTSTTSTAGSAAAAWSTLLLEPLPARPTVAIFGVGHVGYELARILSRLEIQLHLVDSRADQLDPLRLADVTDGAADVDVHHAVLGEMVLERLPRGAHVLIMTHDHAEDFALCDAALRLPQLGSIGLIGSSAKWSRFRAQLWPRPATTPDRIARITCPIGCPAITGKEPAVIAVGVAAALVAPDAVRCRPPVEAVTSMTLYRATIIDTPGDPFAATIPPTRCAVDHDGGDRRHATA